MLVNKDGFITNALIVNVDDHLEKLAQDSRVDVAVRVPAFGVPLTPNGKLCDVIYKAKPTEGNGTAMKRTSVLKYKCNLFKEGVVVETLAHRRKYLEFLVKNAKNKANRTRAERELSKFNNASSGLRDTFVLWLAAVDSAGELYVSSAGVLKREDVSPSKITFSDGANLFGKLSNHVSKLSDSEIANLNIQRVSPLRTGVKVSEAEVKEAISLTGCLLTIRGLHSAGRSAEDVISEWNLVAQPLLEALPGQVFTSWEIPWAISTFPSLKLSAADQARANFVAPYLTVSLGILASTASDVSVGDIRLVTALEQGKWSKTNNVYSVTFGKRSVQIDGVYTSVVDNALAMERSSVDAVARQVLEAAEVYGMALGDGSLWSSTLWLEWAGIQGLLGGLAMNASA